MEYAKIETEYYCPVDLHDKTMYVIILNNTGKILYRKNLKNNFNIFKEELKEFWGKMSVGVESTHNYYWLLDGCRNEGIPFYLGHALYMRAIRGKKKKDDPIDSETIGHLMRSNFFPKAYPYPKEKRALRDLLRRRIKYVRLRGASYSHIKLIFSQQGVTTLINTEGKSKKKRNELLEYFQDEDIVISIMSDIDTIELMSKIILRIERRIIEQTNSNHQQEFLIIKTFPGIGDILSLTILYEIDTISRFQSAQKFSSYSRVVKCQRESSGKKTDNLNQKIGNPYLKWAFSQAAVCSIKESETVAKFYEKLKIKYGKTKAMSVLRHKIAVSIYNMLVNKEEFNEDKFLRSYMK